MKNFLLTVGLAVFVTGCAEYQERTAGASCSKNLRAPAGNTVVLDENLVVPDGGIK